MTSRGHPNNQPQGGVDERNPKFTENLLLIMRRTLLEKKFGKEFYEKYIRMSVRKTFEDPETGEVVEPADDAEMSEKLDKIFEEPLMPEVRSYEEKVGELKTPAEIIEFAQKEGREFTEDDMAQARSDALDILKFEMES